MRADRRRFLKQVGGLAAAGSGALVGPSALANGHPVAPEDPMAVLVDLGVCVGCRLCEHACKQAHGVDPGSLESYDDQSVFKIKRRPGPTELTVLNSWPGPSEKPGDKPVYAKVNCMHCNHASCVSACIVGALSKEPDGAVIYDAWKCIGCRYCMVACPFQIPAYEYNDVWTPEVRKCDFCHHRTSKGEIPACIEACPRQVMTYGRRSELIALAHQKIARHPDRYVDHVYGEHEVGGTSWLYLSPVPFEQAGFLTLGSAAPPALTEAIQHGVFKYWIAPVGWYSFLALMMWKTRGRDEGRRKKDEANGAESDASGDCGQRSDLIGPASSGLSRTSPGIDSTSPGMSARSSSICPKSSSIDSTSPGMSATSSSLSDRSSSPLDPAEGPLAHESACYTARENFHERCSGPGALGYAGLADSGSAPALESGSALESGATLDIRPLPREGSWGEGSVAMLAGPVVREATPHHDDHHEPAAPAGRSLNTPGVWALAILVLSGVGFMLYRFLFGLAASTNLDQQHPWGLWIAMDVGSGIALAGGGFVTAALVHVFHREHYHMVARSALLTALLGYTFYVPGLLADIGRWYNIWHPTLPNMWQGNSVLFEVGICVMLYLNVQYLELTPIICERFLGGHSRLSRWARKLHDVLERIMPALLVGGVALSTFHQSSLGNLMVIAPYKLHHLWWSPISPLLFLVSAMMVGFPMVIFTLLFAYWSLKRTPRMDVLGPLSLYAALGLGIYLVLKVGDVIWRDVYGDILSLSPLGISWIAEMLIGVVIPLGMILMPSVRRSPRLLAAACFGVILGVVLNRLNVFVLGYNPPYAEKSYFPSVAEFAVSIGLVAALMLTYRVAVTYLPILPAEKGATS